jgi:hypothetical protein
MPLLKRPKRYGHPNPPNPVSLCDGALRVVAVSPRAAGAARQATAGLRSFAPSPATAPALAPRCSFALLPHSLRRVS